jgi:hypothetical protein
LSLGFFFSNTVIAADAAVSGTSAYQSISVPASCHPSGFRLGIRAGIKNTNGSFRFDNTPGAPTAAAVSAGQAGGASAAQIAAASGLANSQFVSGLQSKGSISITGGIGEIFAGYDFGFSGCMIGGVEIFGGYDNASQTFTSNFIPTGGLGGGSNEGYYMKLNRSAYFGGGVRFGAFVSDSTLLYLKGGAEYQKYKLTGSTSAVPLVGAANGLVAFPFPDQSKSKVAPFAAVGIECANPLFSKARFIMEYKCTFMGSNTFTIPGSTNAALQNALNENSLPVNTSTYNHTVTIGAVYKF